MTGTAPAYQALYRACMKEAASQGRTLMQRLITRAAESLTRTAVMADEFDRKLLGDAARTLVKHETALCEMYPQALLTEFAHAIAGDMRKSGSVSFDALELMGDEQIRENLDLLRLQQSVKAQ